MSAAYWYIGKQPFVSWEKQNNVARSLIDFFGEAASFFAAKSTPVRRFFQLLILHNSTVRNAKHEWELYFNICKTLVLRCFYRQKRIL